MLTGRFKMANTGTANSSNPVVFFDITIGGQVIKYSNSSSFVSLIPSYFVASNYRLT